METRLAEAVAVSYPAGRSAFVGGTVLASLKLLIGRCLELEPGQRITAAAALEAVAQLLARDDVVHPTRADNLLLPSPVLLFTLPKSLPTSSEQEQPSIIPDQVECIRALCAQHGRVLDARVDMSRQNFCRLYVQFLSPQAAIRARVLLTCPSAPLVGGGIIVGGSGNPSPTQDLQDAGKSSFSSRGIQASNETCSSGGIETLRPGFTLGDALPAVRCAGVESPPRSHPPDMQRGFLSEFYPLDLWYKSIF